MSDSWKALSALMGALLLALLVVGRWSENDAAGISPVGSSSGPTSAVRTTEVGGASIDAGAASPDGQPKPEDYSTDYPLQKNPLAGCTLCHVDVEDEFVGTVGTIHFKEKVGCKTCHGASEGHLADENNEVKPDEMFARKDVDRLCERCHECARAMPAKPELTADGQRKVCTDCHGPHDLVLAGQTGSSE